MKNKYTQNVQKSQLLDKPANILRSYSQKIMYYSEIALSALHFVESDRTIK